MRIGILVEGRAEYESMPFIISKCQFQNHTILKPLHCNVHPKASLEKIAETIANSRYRIFQSQNIDKLVVLLDKEDNDQSECSIVRSLEAKLNERKDAYNFKAEIAVVLKVTKYENWLVADRSVFKQYPKRFPRHTIASKKVKDNGADRIDALKVIEEALDKNDYDKIKDAVLICQKADIKQAALNSRSLRRLLRVLEIPPYSDQSKSPVNDRLGPL